MDTKLLLAFIVLSEELHFGRAASRLGIAQPALSQQIRRLEGELGKVLFDRSTRTVALTESGVALIDPARRALAEVDAVRRVAAAGELGQTGRVVIGFGGLTSRHALPALTRAVRARLPGIDLVLTGQSLSRVALDEVAAGAFDLAFTRLPVADSSMDYRILSYESFVLAMPSDHPLAARSSLRLADFAADPFVCYPSAQGSRIREALMRGAAEAGFVPRIGQEAPDTYTILSLVAAGVGVSLTVSSLLGVEVPGLVFRTLAEPALPDLASALVWRADNPSTAFRSVLKVALDVLPVATG